MLAGALGRGCADRPLAAAKGQEEAVVGVEEQIEAAEGVSLSLGRCGHLGDDDVHGGAHDHLLERLELALAAKDHVGGVFDLHEAPVIAGTEMA